MTELGELLLMVDPVGDQVRPVSARAFSAISAPKAQVLARNCVALFLTKSGGVLHIETIEPKETGITAAVKLWLGRSVPSHYVFSDVDISLDDFRVMVLDAATFMRQNPQPQSWWLMTAPLEDIRGELFKATSLKELYDRIRFPDQQDCLGLL